MDNKIMDNGKIKKEGHMSNENIFDLEEQFIGQFDREDLLAFFDFQLAVDQNENVQGLCRISKPKKGEAISNYISLLFIIDKIDDRFKGEIDSHMKGISWDDLKNKLRGCEMIVPMSHVSYETRQFSQDVEIYLGRDMQITREYIGNDLYPAILEIFRCKSNELTFWEDFPQ